MKIKRKHHNAMRTLALLALLAVMVFAVLGSVNGDVYADSAWDAKYWDNKTLSGNPIVQRQESEINFDWGDYGPPGVPDDNFSARWTRNVDFPVGGTYRFTATMDDGMRVFVDGVRVIDAWVDSQVRSVVADVTIAAGRREIKVEYYEAGGKAVAKLNWVLVGAPTQFNAWRGEYFNNMFLAGAPALVRDDANIDFNWGGGSPSGLVAADNFSVRWTRDLTLNAGRYRFATTTDDGVRLWVNGRLIIDQWRDSAGQTYTAEIDLPGGSVPIKMEYYENAGGALARLTWTQLSAAGGGPWRGEYFNNTTLSGSPVLVRDEPQVNFNWGTGSPAPGIVASDNFSARWTRTLPLSAGRYRFTAVVDDGVRVYVNGQLVINAWFDQPPQTHTGEITLPGGNTTIQVEYYERGGGAQVQVSWTQLSGGTTPPPTSGATGTVVSAFLNMRRGPGFEYSVISQLRRGQTVALTGYRTADNHWVQIVMPTGGEAWVSGRPAYLQTSVPVSSLAIWQGTSPGGPTGAQGTVANAYYLNMRQGPGVQYSVITVLPRGQLVNLLGRNNGATWVKVSLPSGAQGWISASYLATTYPLASLPVVG